MANYVITSKTAEAMVKMYNNGMSMTDISIKTDVPKHFVKSIIKEHTGFYLENKPSNEKPVKKISKHEQEKMDIINAYKAGKSIDEISKEMHHKDYTIKAILVGADLYRYDDPSCNGAITIWDLFKFRDTVVKVGGRYVVQEEIRDPFNDEIIKKHRIVVTVKEKYPYIVVTDKGCFQYFDLYMFRNNKI